MRVHRHIAAVMPFLGVTACGGARTHQTQSPPLAVANDSGSWTTPPSMRYARAAHAVVSTGDAIYAFAGTGTGGKPVLEIERFDGAAWSIVDSLPGHGLNAPVAAAIDGRIYVIGGFNTTTNVPTSDVLSWNPATKAWQAVAPLPSPRGGHGVAVLNGRIHVLGGGNSQRTLADHSVYDPATDTWTERAPLPRSEGSPAVVAFDGKLYAIGGRSGPGDYGFVDIYDPASDTWSAGPPIEPRGTAGAVEYCGAIYVFGGESQARGESLSEVLRLRRGDAMWQTRRAMPTPRNFARAVVLRDHVYVVGGSPVPGRSHSSEGSTVVERFECGTPSSGH